MHQVAYHRRRVPIDVRLHIVDCGRMLLMQLPKIKQEAATQRSLLLKS